jgi:hypothetical protein
MPTGREREKGSLVKESLNHRHILLLVIAAVLCPKATSAQASSDLMPTTMAQCEPDSCGAWSFEGKRGVGRWTTGAVANLTIERFEGDAVSIRREDTTGVGKGIKGLYTGTRNGDRIEGTFTWVWPGGLYPAGTVNWHATIQHLPQDYNTAWRAQSARTFPSGLKRFNLNGTWQHNEMVDGVKSVFQMQIDQSGDDISIVVRDKRAPLDGLTFYLGRMVNDSLIGGQQLNMGEPLRLGKTQWFQDDIAVVDPDHLLPKIGGGVYFRVSNPGPDDAPCDPENSSHTQSVYAFFRGQVAFKAQDYKKAVCWIRVGAVLGDAQSQGVLAILLHEGVGTSKDFPQAFSWAQKSATQNNIVGETILAELYQKGDGTAADAKKAEFWRGAARVAERRKNEQQWGALLNTPTASGLTGMDAIRLEFGMELKFDEIEQEYRNSEACLFDHPEKSYLYCAK